MKIVIKFVVIFSYVNMVFTCFACEERDQIQHEKLLMERLQHAEVVGYRGVPEPGDLAAVNSTIKTGGKGEAWAIIQLYRWGQSGRLNLRWWESQDSLNRLLMLLLKLNDLDEERHTHFLDKAREDATRFAELEKRSRLEEIDSAQEIYLDPDLRKSLLDRVGK